MKFWMLPVFSLGLSLLVVTACAPVSNNSNDATPTSARRDSAYAIQGQYELLHEFKGGYGTIRTLDWSPDGKQIAMGCAITPIPIWGLETKRISKELHGAPNSVDNVAWSPDGEYLAAGLAEPTTTLRIWEVASGNIVYAEDLSTYTDVAWTGDGTKLAVSAGTDFSLSGEFLKDSEIKLISPDSWEVQVSLTFTSYVWRLAWAPDSRHLAFVSTSDDDRHTIIVWDTLNNSQIEYPVESTAYINALSWSPNGKHLASAYSDGSIIVWDTAKLQKIKTLAHGGGPVNSVAWQPRGRYLISAGDDMYAKVWDTTTYEQIEALKHENWVDTVAWSRDGALLATAGHEGILRVWKPKQDEK
jgi:WD40 repeat protein